VDSIGGEGIVEGVEVTNKIYIVAGKQWQGEGEQKRSHGRSKARAWARESKNKEQGRRGGWALCQQSNKTPIWVKLAAKRRGIDASEKPEKHDKTIIHSRESRGRKADDNSWRRQQQWRWSRTSDRQKLPFIL
jgi:hypothetical protein